MPRGRYDHPSLLIQKLIKFVLLVHALFACAYGFLVESGSSTMDACMAILMLVESAEVALKVIGNGPRRFWFLGHYDVGKTFEQWENRTALVIMGISLVVWLVTRLTKYADGLGFTSDANFFRLFIVLPTIRLFFTLKQARRVPFVLIPLRQYLLSVVALMMLFSYMYAIVGVTLFEGNLNSIANSVDPEMVRLASFDTVPSSMLTLTQVLIGEGWHEIMYATMNGKHSWYAPFIPPLAALPSSPPLATRGRYWAGYFVIFVLMQTLLLTNLLVGVVLDATNGFSIDDERRLQESVLHGDKLIEFDELLTSLPTSHASNSPGPAEETRQSRRQSTVIAPDLFASMEQRLQQAGDRDRRTSNLNLSFLNMPDAQAANAPPSLQTQVSAQTSAPLPPRPAPLLPFLSRAQLIPKGKNLAASNHKILGASGSGRATVQPAGGQRPSGGSRASERSMMNGKMSTNL